MSITIEGLAAHLNRELPAAGPELDELQLHLDAAVEYAEHYTGPLIDAARTYSVYPSGPYLVLPTPGVSGTVIVRDTAGTAVTLDPRYIDRGAGIIELHGLSTAPDGPWTVEITGADNDPPADLTLAVYIIAAHLWETQRGSSSRVGYMRNRRGTSEGDGEAPVYRGFAIPNRAAELLAAYRLPAFA